MKDSQTAAQQAFLMLRIAFTVAPILFGLDKFAEVHLLLVGGYGDVALRDFGLMLGALTLARLAWSELASTSTAQSRAFRSGTGGSVPASGT